MIELLDYLLPPFEILELKDGESIEIIILKWKIGKIDIIPRYPQPPIRKTIRTLRIWVPREIKPFGMDYWDITSQTLIAQLTPYLERPDFNKLKYKIIAKGVAPYKRFQVIVSPILPS